MKTLLIVDVQNDFLPGGALAVPGGDEIIPVINSLQKHFDVVLATLDWHPHHHSSFETLWPPHCIQGTKGAEFSALLDTSSIQKVFYKGTDPLVDSYSAFFDNAHKQETGLRSYLQEHHLNEIYIVGLATDYCVYYSVRDALELGLMVTVIVDGCRGIKDSEKALSAMQKMGARLITSYEFLANSANRLVT